MIRMGPGLETERGVVTNRSAGSIPPRAPEKRSGEMRAKPMPEPYCPHCHGTGWTYEDVWVDDGWSVSGDECICVWEKWNDVVLSEAVRQILETSDEDVLADRYPPLVESVSEDR